MENIKHLASYQPKRPKYLSNEESWKMVLKTILEHEFLNF